MDTENVCDCGRTKVVVLDPATYPYSDESPLLQCNSCKTHVKHYEFPAERVDAPTLALRCLAKEAVHPGSATPEDWQAVSAFLQDTAKQWLPGSDDE